MIVEFTTRQVEPDITLVELSGRLTLGNRLTEVEHAIKDCIEKGARKLALDLANLTFMDSAGIGMVMVCAGRIREVGGRMHIVGAQGHVKKVLELTQLHQVIPMVPDLSSLLAKPDASSATTPE
jgi:anti-sigma B factor antagonist